MSQVTHRLPGVFAVEVSQNRKLGPCSATYVAQPSCPPTCRFLDAGCYAEHGQMGIHTRRLNAEAAGLTPLDLAANEAEVVDALPARLDLRLHVVGDCATPPAAHPVAHAAVRYSKRSRRGVAAWGYTHAWRSVARRDWHSVSMLASCESPYEALDAMGRGYAAAVTVREFRSGKAYSWGGVRVLPCPEQTRGDVSCVDCRLCFESDKLLSRGDVIGFRAHGAGKSRMSLPVLEAVR